MTNEYEPKQVKALICNILDELEDNFKRVSSKMLPLDKIYSVMQDLKSLFNIYSDLDRKDCGKIVITRSRICGGAVQGGQAHTAGHLPRPRGANPRRHFRDDFQGRNRSGEGSHQEGGAYGAAGGGAAGCAGHLRGR